MKLSEINLTFLKKNYLRIDTDTDDRLLQACLDASIALVQQQTGKSLEELEQSANIPLAVMAMCADMYELRQYTLSTAQINPFAKQIIDANCLIYLEREGDV